MIDQEKLNQIEYCINNKLFCAIGRDCIDDVMLYGIPLKISNELLLLGCVEDFLFNGYIVINLNDITTFKRDESDIFIDNILKNEKILPFQFNTDFDISNLKNLMSQFLGKSVILECEKNDEDVFLIGEITKVNKSTVDIWNFDGTGVWDDSPTTVNLSDITRVSVEVRYLITILKYVQKRL